MKTFKTLIVAMLILSVTFLLVQPANARGGGGGGGGHGAGHGAGHGGWRGGHYGGYGGGHGGGLGHGHGHPYYGGYGGPRVLPKPEATPPEKSNAPVLSVSTSGKAPEKIPLLIHAEVYKWVDEKGTVHFTDDYSKITPSYRDQVEIKKVVQEE